jgi:uncharacterized protein YdeI (YjbR/CyaY-like superfamily)
VHKTYIFMAKMNEIPVFYAPNRAEWRKWLAENYETSTGVWLMSYRKESDTPQ